METFAFHLMPYRDVQDRAWPFPNDSWDPEKGSRYYNEYLDQLELAAELGFDGLGVNEHHFSTYGLQPSPVVTASNLAARTDDVTIAFYGNIPAIRGNPIRLAEELAMLDNITEGRIVSGFPRGIPSEYFAYGVDIEESRGRFEEAWELIVKTWTAEEPFDWDGEYWQYENVYAWPRPYQQDPHPPLWMPAESEESLRWAAQHEVPTGLVFNDDETIGELFDTYRAFAREDFGWTPSDEDFTVSRAVYVAETDEQAREEAEEHLRNHYQHMTAGVHLGVTANFMGDDLYDPERHDEYVEQLTPHGEFAYNFDFDDFREFGEIIVGSPETVVADLEDLYETVGGFGTLAGNFQFGTLPDDLVRKNMRLYADEVMPEVRGLGSN